MSEAALKAGVLLRERFRTGDAKIYEKAPFDVVTEADLDAEECIKAVLSKADSTCGFYTEEHGKTHDDCTNRRWLIDPLDGTRNFSRGIAIYATLIALQEKNSDGHFVTTAGAIYLPESHTLYYAQHDKGARRYHDNGSEAALSVANSSKRPDKMVFLGARDAQHTDAGSIISIPSFRFRDIGCTGAALVTVAEGKAEGLLALYANPWDICAGALIIREAGGQTASLSTNLPEPEKGEHFVAGEPHTYHLMRHHS